MSSRRTHSPDENAGAKRQHAGPAAHDAVVELVDLDRVYGTTADHPDNYMLHLVAYDVVIDPSNVTIVTMDASSRPLKITGPANVLKPITITSLHAGVHVLLFKNKLAITTHQCGMPVQVWDDTGLRMMIHEPDPTRCPMRHMANAPPSFKDSGDKTMTALQELMTDMLLEQQQQQVTQPVQTAMLPLETKPRVPQRQVVHLAGVINSIGPMQTAAQNTSRMPQHYREVAVQITSNKSDVRTVRIQGDLIARLDGMPAITAAFRPAIALTKLTYTRFDRLFATTATAMSLDTTALRHLDAATALHPDQIVTVPESERMA